MSAARTSAAGRSKSARTARAEAREPRGLQYRTAKHTDVEALVDLSLRTYRVSSAEARREF
ncbi:MAG TPA: hypothetical protein VNM39_06975, partial [Verrucomicrobiae bacterium]|nr:hypothetical protein [Verrucomicrobiae bacterium]